MLFKLGAFKSAAGLDLGWKIECDALDADDWACIARVAWPTLMPFSSVHGVPRGGETLARAFFPYVADSGPPLFVGDVWTTGKSMRAYALEMQPVLECLYGGDVPHWKGFVVFARGELPPHVSCFCKIAV